MNTTNPTIGWSKSLHILGNTSAEQKSNISVDLCSEVNGSILDQMNYSIHVYKTCSLPVYLGLLDVALFLLFIILNVGIFLRLLSFLQCTNFYNYTQPGPWLNKSWLENWRLGIELMTPGLQTAFY